MIDILNSLSGGELFLAGCLTGVIAAFLLALMLMTTIFKALFHVAWARS